MAVGRSQEWLSGSAQFSDRTRKGQVLLPGNNREWIWVIPGQVQVGFWANFSVEKNFVPIPGGDTPSSGLGIRWGLGTDDPGGIFQPLRSHFGAQRRRGISWMWNISSGRWRISLIPIHQPKKCHFSCLELGWADWNSHSSVVLRFWICPQSWGFTGCPRARNDIFKSPTRLCCCSNPSFSWALFPLDNSPSILCREIPKFLPPGPLLGWNVSPLSPAGCDRDLGQPRQGERERKRSCWKFRSVVWSSLLVAHSDLSSPGRGRAVAVPEPFVTCHLAQDAAKWILPSPSWL